MKWRQVPARETNCMMLSRPVLTSSTRHTVGRDSKADGGIRTHIVPGVGVPGAFAC